MAGRLSSDDDDLRESHEINITPFIDVMLVLLIIFMVAAPLSTVDVPVELPVAQAHVEPRPDKPTFITVKSDLTLAIGETPVSREGLVPAIDMATQIQRSTRLYLRADKSVPYGELMRVLNELRIGGYLKVALVGLEPAGDAGASGGEAPSLAPPKGEAP